MKALLNTCKLDLKNIEKPGKHKTSPKKVSASRPSQYNLWAMITENI